MQQTINRANYKAFLTMYLNVKLTPPTSGIGSGHIPKTPEILNSLISLTSPVRSLPYACQGSNPDVNGIENANYFEEYSSFGGGDSTLLSGSSPACDRTAKSLELAFACANSSIGTPSPPVPELPSPVQPFETTKSALIKEGLKYQIQTKLQASGFSSPTSFADQKVIKEELTMEDEERRSRRRERNKVAATKCRNKKKERTSILVNESEEVEGENLKLKSEIQRLKSEKEELEKLLEDPNHIARCLRTNGAYTHSIPADAASLSSSKPIQNIAPTNGHYTVPNNMTTIHKESTGMSYSTLSVPSPNSTTPYIYNHTDKTHYGTPSNKTSSTLSSYPLTCADAQKCSSEVEESDNSLMHLTSLSTAALTEDPLYSDSVELSSSATAQYTQCMQDPQINVMAGNFANPNMTAPPLATGQMMYSVCCDETLEQKANTLRNDENNFSCRAGQEDIFCAKPKAESDAIENEKYTSLKSMHLPKMPKSSSTAVRFCPYGRSDTSAMPELEYTEQNVVNHHFDTSLCTSNISGKFSADYCRQLYQTCTYESI